MHSGFGLIGHKFCELIELDGLNSYVAVVVRFCGRFSELTLVRSLRLTVKYDQYNCQLHHFSLENWLCNMIANIF